MLRTILIVGLLVACLVPEAAAHVCVGSARACGPGGGAHVHISAFGACAGADGRLDLSADLCAEPGLALP